MIEEGLRDYFVIRALKPNKPLSMPSTYVDELWHAFILDTKNYQDYCKKAFGETLHHIPDYAFTDKQKNIRMFTYQTVCQMQGINPIKPANQVPRLFAVDNKIKQSLGLMTTAAFSTALFALMNELATHYKYWYQTITAITAEAAGGGSGVDIDYNGNVKCGSSGTSGDSSCDGGCGSSCGGGCGGGCGS